MTGVRVTPNAFRGAHGALRVGTVEDNSSMLGRGLAGLVAAVTREYAGYVRFYVRDWSSDWPNVLCWTGPYNGLSEEIENLDEA